MAAHDASLVAKFETERRQLETTAGGYGSLEAGLNGNSRCSAY